MKTFFLWIGRMGHKKIRLFLGALFTKAICTFLKSVWKDGFFDAPFDIFKEKKLWSLRRNNEPFWELKRSKLEEIAHYFEKRLFIKRSMPFQNFMPHIKIMKFCRNPWYRYLLHKHFSHMGTFFRSKKCVSEKKHKKERRGEYLVENRLI